MDAAPLPSALDARSQIDETVAGRQMVFFLDFDGTLSPIVSRPEEAVLPPAAAAVLAALQENHVVCIVSGRGLDDIRARVNVPGLHYAGDHGCRIIGPPHSELAHEVGTSCRATLSEAAADLHGLLTSVPGVLVEDKGLSLSVHYRLTPEDQVEAVVAAVERIRLRFPSLRLTEGKCVLELRPGEEWGKGHAMTWLLQALGLTPENSCPICIGDDLTDEDLFAAAEGWGVSILVTPSERPTLAAYSLPGPEQVVSFLRGFIRADD